jgi:hypothetical protein
MDPKMNPKNDQKKVPKLIKNQGPKWTPLGGQNIAKR